MTTRIVDPMQLTADGEDHLGVVAASRERHDASGLLAGPFSPGFLGFGQLTDLTTGRIVEHGRIFASAQHPQRIDRIFRPAGLHEQNGFAATGHGERAGRTKAKAASFPMTSGERSDGFGLGEFSHPTILA